MLLGLLEGGPHGVVGLEVDRDAAAVVGVERFDDHGEIEALGGADQLLAGDREAEVAIPPTQFHQGVPTAP